jgi:hypothetical protein
MNLLPLTNAGRRAKFGKFRFVHSPTPTNSEHVTILDGWAEANLDQVWVPELRRRVTVHRKARDSFLELWATWGKLGLLGGEECPGVEGRGLVLSYAGCWVPRFKRQSGTWNERVAKCRTLGAQSLSSHSWGTAVDLNPAWNRLGQPPAPLGTTGSVLELVPTAEQLGWFWGGFFKRRPDGMHYEYSGFTTRVVVQRPAKDKLSKARPAAKGRR